MRGLSEHLSSYAQCHRSRRNIATHAVGIPMIVAAAAILLSRPETLAGGFPISLAGAASLALALFYVALDWRLGAGLAAALAACCALGHWAAGLPTGQWLGLGLGMLAAGWALQFLGHHFEGKKPAFLDDVMGLAEGPLFVAAELSFALGLRAKLRQNVEDQAGPTRR